MFDIEYSLSLDLRSSMTKKSNIKFTRNDTKSYVINIKLYNGSSMVDYNDISSAFVAYQKPDNSTPITRKLDITPKYLRAEIGTDEISVLGTVLAETLIYGLDGERITSPKLSFDVVEGIIDKVDVEGYTEFNALTQLITDYNTMTYNEGSAKTYEQIRKEQEIVRQNNETQRIITNNELQGSITIGQQTKTNLDNSITTAITKKTELDSSINTSITKKSDLDTSISAANTTKTNLDGSINNANISRSNLDSTIVVGNGLKNTLDTNISVGSSLSNELVTNTVIANTTNNNLINNITTAVDKINTLESDISIATAKHTDLTNSISLSNTAKSNLDYSTSQANNSKVYLDDSVTQATNKKNDLDGGISNATTKYNNLNTAITNATNINTTLNGSIETGTSKIQEINNKITEFTNNENTRITAESSRVTTFNNNETTRQNTFNSNEATRQSNETSRVNAEATRVSQENARQTGYNNMLNNSNTIWKDPVANFAAIATTYPSPQLYWTTQTVDDGKIYRYNGSVWQHINTLNTTAIQNLVNELSTSQSTTSEVTSNIITLPSTVKEGLLQGTLKGRTLKNELIYNRDTFAEWTVAGAGSTKGLNGIHLVTDGSIEYAQIPVVCKPNQKYGILYNVTACNLNNDFNISATSITGSTVTIPRAVGNNKTVITTANPIVNNALRFVTISFNTNGTYIDFKDVRMFELPTGSQIETDFTNLTADQLSVKYPYISGLQNVQDIRIKSVGVNLFDKSKISLNTQIVGSTGVVSSFTGRTLSGYIRVEPNTTYIRTINGDLHRQVAYFDINKNFISGEGIQGTGVFTTPTNTAFIRTSFNDANVTANSMIICKGSVLPSYEPYKETSSYINVTNIRNLLNGVFDEITLAGDEIQRVSNPLTLLGSDIGILSTTGINVDVVIFGDAKTPNKATWTDEGTGMVYVYNMQEVPYSQADNASNVGKFYTKANGQLGFIVAKGTYANLATAQASFPSQTLIYQLASTAEIKTKIEGIESLIARPNGTIYMEPFYKFVAKPVAGVITIPNTSLPIKSIESLKKIVSLDDGSKEYQSVTVSSNTTNTIIPTNADNNAFYEVVYEYDSALTTIPTFSYTYSSNIKAIIDSNTQAIAELDKEVTNMSDFTVAYLLSMEMRLLAEEARKATAQSDSTATDVAGLKADFNALLAKLRTAKLMS